MVYPYMGIFSESSHHGCISALYSPMGVSFNRLDSMMIYHCKK